MNIGTPHPLTVILAIASFVYVFFKIRSDVQQKAEPPLVLREEPRTRADPPPPEFRMSRHPASVTAGNFSFKVSQPDFQEVQINVKKKKKSIVERPKVVLDQMPAHPAQPPLRKRNRLDKPESRLTSKGMQQLLQCQNKVVGKSSSFKIVDQSDDQMHFNPFESDNPSLSSEFKLSNQGKPLQPKFSEEVEKIEKIQKVEKGVDESMELLQGIQTIDKAIPRKPVQPKATLDLTPRFHNNLNDSVQPLKKLAPLKVDNPFLKPATTPISLSQILKDGIASQVKNVVRPSGQQQKAAQHSNPFFDPSKFKGNFMQNCAQAGKQIKQISTAAGGLFNGISQVSSLFGNGKPAQLTAQRQNTKTDGIISAVEEASTLLGKAKQATAGGLFGLAAQTVNAGGGLFGKAAQAGGGLFGKAAQTVNAGGGLFGKAAQGVNVGGGGLFSKAAQTLNAGGGLFGKAVQAVNTGGGLFSNTNLFKPQQTAATVGGLFGKSTQAVSGLGGAMGKGIEGAATGLFSNLSQSAKGQGLFGNGGLAGGLFKSSENGLNKQTAESTGGFGAFGGGLFGDGGKSKPAEGKGLFESGLKGGLFESGLNGGLFSNGSQSQTSALFGFKS